jgi:hypothetical protein
MRRVECSGYYRYTHVPAGFQTVTRRTVPLQIAITKIRENLETSASQRRHMLRKKKKLQAISGGIIMFPIIFLAMVSRNRGVVLIKGHRVTVGDVLR